MSWGALRIGVVVDTHPEDYSVDVVMVDDGNRITGVQVLAQSASTRTGTVDLPEIPQRTNKWDITQRTEQDVIAVVGYIGMHPVVVGFIYPQVNQMLFDDKKRRITRHQSDVYWTVDGDGNIELFHPSGTYIRIAENPEHEDLTGGGADGKFSVDRNTGKQVHFRLQMAGNKAALDVAPNGNVTLHTDGTINVEADGNVTVKAPRVTLDTPLVEVPDGDVVASGVSLVEHIHGGVEPGGSTTSEPIK